MLLRRTGLRFPQIPLAHRQPEPRPRTRGRRVTFRLRLFRQESCHACWDASCPSLSLRGLRRTPSRADRERWMTTAAGTRRRRRLRGWFALVVFVSALGLPAATASHQTRDDDAACGQPRRGPIRPTLQLQTSSPPRSPGHCALCHWLRTAAWTNPDLIPPVWLLLTALLVAPRPLRMGSALPRHRPSRAPPPRPSCHVTSTMN